MSEQLFTLTKILDIEKHGAYCTLLEYKGLRILLDCGIPKDYSI